MPAIEKLYWPIVGVLFLFATYIGVWYLSDEAGYSRCLFDNENYVSSQKEKIIKLQAKVQKFEDERAEHTQSLTIINRERSDAIDTIESQRAEKKRIELQWRSALKERDKAIADSLHLVDIEHIERVYRESVDACHGLTQSERTVLVPERHKESTSEYVAEGIKRIIKSRCDIAVNYNSLYQSYQRALSAKIQTEDKP